MRLHRLEMTAFGPFAETSVVDFDELGADGLFLLHGQTGAGKTTVLDAIAFALYGRVPGARGESKRLHSDHADVHTPPKVSLEATLGGRRLRLIRTPEFRRPKKRGTGWTDENATATLEWLDGRGPHLSRIPDIGDEVNRLLGMSADQFFQVVLLPQGDFARFLRSDNEDRERLLEKLFDTERFGTAEQWLANRRRESAAEVETHRQHIDRLVAQVGVAAGLSATETVGPLESVDWSQQLLDTARTTVTAAATELERCRSESRRAQAAAEEQRRLHDLHRRLTAARTQLEAYRAAAPHRSALRDELDRARRAEPVAASLGDARAAALTHRRHHDETRRRAETLATRLLEPASAELSGTPWAAADLVEHELADTDLAAGLAALVAEESANADLLAERKIAASSGGGTRSAVRATPMVAREDVDGTKSDDRSGVSGERDSSGDPESSAGTGSTGIRATDSSVREHAIPIEDSSVEPLRDGRGGDFGSDSKSPVDQNIPLGVAEDATDGRHSGTRSPDAPSGVVELELFSVAIDDSVGNTTAAQQVSLDPEPDEQQVPGRKKATRGRRNSRRTADDRPRRVDDAPLVWELGADEPGLFAVDSVSIESASADTGGQDEADDAASLFDETWDTAIDSVASGTGGPAAAARDEPVEPGVGSGSGAIETGSGAIETSVEAARAPSDAAAGSAGVQGIENGPVEAGGGDAGGERAGSGQRPGDVVAAERVEQGGGQAAGGYRAAIESSVEVLPVESDAASDSPAVRMPDLSGASAPGQSADGSSESTPVAAEYDSVPAGERVSGLVVAVARWSAQIGALDEVRADAESAERLAAELAELRAEQDKIAARVQRCGQRHAQLPEEIRTAETRLRESSDALAALPGLSAESERLRTAARAAIELAERRAESEPARIEYEAARVAHVDARERTLDVRERRLAGMAAELAGALHDGTPCAVCGSVEHPAPASTTSNAATKADEERAVAAERAAENTRDRALARMTDLERQIEVLVERGGDVDRAELAVALTDITQRHDAARTAAARTDDLTVARARLRSEETRLQDELRELEGRATAVAAGIVAADRRSAELTERLRVAAGADGTVERRRARLEALVREASELREARAESAAAREQLLTAARRVEQLGRAAELVTGPDSVVAPGANEPDYTVLSGYAGVVDAATRTPQRQAAIDEELAAADRTRAYAEAVLAEPDIEAAATATPGDPDAAEALVARSLAELDAAVAGHAEAARRVTLLEDLGGQLWAAVDRIAPMQRAHEELAGLAEVVAGRGENNRRMSLRSYVLAARLEEVAIAGSVRLRRMSGGRYEFVHTDAAGTHGRRGGLGLDIRDDYTGAIRPAKTLSGGETFMASLALALGLADVVAAESGGLVLDTLFIDEGFGSLDADTLDAVMGVLDELRSGGRVVGIVSHVDEMRQRIPSRLHVVRTPTGSHLHATVA
ncbi:AAA family ATPase [Nocardia aurantia]|uniref:Nuclease SbcCD subunit C n=1 Tax=Nocardia aurantia TaxID=2585199 RepID=A0A7K0DRZ2_9NOCA|nr:AAA family ATPase [Nocardia aurantia]MQY28535.1 hypothetical protein [Nocardia aurantia]